MNRARTFYFVAGVHLFGILLLVMKEKIYVLMLLGIALSGEALAGGFISIAFKNTLAFLIIILVLLFRPEGLLGKEFIERV